MKFKIPHVYIMFMIVMVFVVIIASFVPAGEYKRVKNEKTGVLTIDTNDFKFVKDSKRIGFLDFFSAFHKGVVRAANIIVLLLIASGAIYVLESSGAIDAGIKTLLKKSSGKEYFIMIALGMVFSTFGSIGFAEGGIPLYPLVITVVMGLGFDRITGLGLAVLSSCIGFTSGSVNLYTTGVAQNILGLELFSGLWFRLLSLFIFFIIAMSFIFRYARKIKKDPTKSLVYEEYKNQNTTYKSDETVDFNLSYKLALLGLLLTVAFNAFAATKLKWGMSQISGMYVVYTIYLAIVLKANPNDIATRFSEGAKRLLPASLAIGFASSVMVLMTQAKIVDTTVYYFSSFLQGKSVILTLLLLFLSIVIFNFFVLSGSGKALILMPILGPLATILNINPQVMTILYQFGDGLTNNLWPTSGALMAVLSMCKVDYFKWLKFSLVPFLVLHVVAFGLILFANMIGLS